MTTGHSSACGRRIAQIVEDSQGSKQDAIGAIHRHCGVSLLRASRIAYGYTLTEAVDLLKGILRERGTPSEGLAHQRLSRWENNLDVPTMRYLDALCMLYRSRPDWLGFGADYSTGERVSEVRQQPDVTDSKDEMKRRDFFRTSTVGLAAATGLGPLFQGRDPEPDLLTVGGLEERTERSGYDIFTTEPADFIPACMINVAAAQRLLLSGRSTVIQRRLHRLIAKNAGFIATRMIDVAPSQDTFNWYRIARQAARRSEDVTVEAWVAGHWSDAHVCYGRVTMESLRMAQAAQSMGGPRNDSSVVFACLVEAGVQARLGNRQATIDAVRRADQLHARLLPGADVADGLHVSEFHLRWHQSNALSAIGERRLANPLRVRAIELPYAEKEVVGRTLLYLDEAALLLDSGEVDRGCNVIMQAWEGLPQEFQQGFVPRRIVEIFDEVGPKTAATREFRELKDNLHVTTLST